MHFPNLQRREFTRPAHACHRRHRLLPVLYVFFERESGDKPFLLPAAQKLTLAET